jgi:hypothetical protein
MYALW